MPTCVPLCSEEVYQIEHSPLYQSFRKTCAKNLCKGVQLYIMEKMIGVVKKLAGA